jgi:hypothetical protein
MLRWAYSFRNNMGIAASTRKTLQARAGMLRILLLLVLLMLLLLIIIRENCEGGYLLSSLTAIPCRMHRISSDLRR